MAVTCTIVEHMHVVNKDEWHDDLEITAPHAFTKPLEDDARLLSPAR